MTTTFIELGGFVLVFIIGIVMGMIGAGGSILTASVLVYVFSISPVLSASYTLLNVGVISTVGFAQYYRRDLVDIRTGLLFAMPALVMVFTMRRFVMPLIPSTVFSYGNFTISKDLMVMLLFAILMIFISWSMIRKPVYKEQVVQQTSPSATMILPGLLVGILTGFTGAGGGFVIVPALIFFSGLDIKKAIGTSLFIIAINTAIGFIGDYSSGVCYNWFFLFKLVSVTVAGMICSNWLSLKVSNDKLKRIFGVTIFVIGCWIIARELLLK